MLHETSRKTLLTMILLVHVFVSSSKPLNITSPCFVCRLKELQDAIKSADQVLHKDDGHVVRDADNVHDHALQVSACFTSMCLEASCCDVS